MIDIKKIASLAVDKKEEFKNLSGTVPYEDKGILFSEMFFLFLCINQSNVTRIIESGRARGQSTLMLAKMFPDNPIISIEHDPNSPDVDIAYQRLKDLNNVSLEFGDATKIAIEVGRSGDIMLIDGPKGYRGLRFALNLLDSGKFPLVFIHDTTKGTSERRFLEKNIKNTLYSDDSSISSISHTLDDEKVKLPHDLKIDGSKGYGFSLACIPFDKQVNYKILLLKAVISGALHRWFKI
ncbi:MAG: hypothetical protein ABGY11_08805 [Candidatus Thioglobus sp.]|jgi:hypothetical protein